MKTRREPALVIDLETKRSFDEVGGHRNMAELGVSVAGVYDYITDSFFALEEDELPQLEELIQKRNRVIGFNIVGFDWPALQPYMQELDLTEVPTLDMLSKVRRELGFRIALNNIAKHTLGEEKSGDGLDATERFRRGEIEKVKNYCLDDVRITRDVFEYGNNHGEIHLESRGRGKIAVPARWAEHKGTNLVRQALAEALATKQLVEIDYVSSRARQGEPTRKTRTIEMHALEDDAVEAFCHLRGEARHFTLQRIITAHIQQKAHTRPTLF